MEESAASVEVARWGSVGATLGVAGALCLLWTLSRSARLLQASRWDRIVGQMAVANLVGVINASLSLVPSAVGDGSASAWVLDSPALCAAQGFLVQWSSLSECGFQAVLAVALLTSVTATAPQRPASQRQWEAKASAVAWLVPFLIAVLPLANVGAGAYGKVGVWCWVVAGKSDTPVALSRLLYMYVWVWAVLLTVVASGVRVWRFVTSRLTDPNLRLGRRVGMMRRIRSRVGAELLAYPLCYLIVWVPASVVRAGQAIDGPDSPEAQNPAATAAQVCCVQLAALLYFVVFASTHPSRVRAALPCLAPCLCCRNPARGVDDHSATYGSTSVPSRFTVSPSSRGRDGGAGGVGGDTDTSEFDYGIPQASAVSEGALGLDASEADEPLLHGV